MSVHSTIEWTDATWNPIRGCTKVSPGCAHCYAETFAERFRGVRGHPYGLCNAIPGGSHFGGENGVQNGNSPCGRPGIAPSLPPGGIALQSPSLRAGF
ncbi:MAG TPA: DUF5131 family protein [Gemmataceae bacterium]|nr:DUF5131 family protein [Gemmataceae bacterium]